MLSVSLLVCLSEGTPHIFHLFLSCIFEHKYLYSTLQNDYPNLFFVHQKCHLGWSAITISHTEILARLLALLLGIQGVLGSGCIFETSCPSDVS
jgi:hypothetical protein